MRPSLTDAVFTLEHLFLAGEAPGCEDAADADDSGVIDLTDAVFLLGYLFLHAEQPAAPGPISCGLDPTEDRLRGCVAGPCG